MEKLKCTVVAPINEYSFFGNKSRMFLKNLINTRTDFDIHLTEYRTSNTKIDIFDEELINLINTPWEDPDVCIYFGNPIHFNNNAKIANIGFLDTGEIISTDDVKLFIQNCNKLNMILVCSNYAKSTLINLKFKDGEEEIKINTPIVIVTEYSVIDEMDCDLNPLLESVSTPKNFLCEGFWEVEENSDFGGRNKDNIGYILTNFLEVFKDIDNPPGLIFNLHGNLPSTVDVNNLNNTLYKIRRMVKHQKSLPPIYLLNGYLDYNQIKSLYNDPKIIAMIRVPQRSDTIESELNFISTGKPILFSEFGSQGEALNYEGNFAVRGQIRDLNLSNISNSSPKVADVYGDSLKLGMYDIFYHYDFANSRTQELSRVFLNTNNSKRMFHIFNNAINYLVPIKDE